MIRRNPRSGSVRDLIMAAVSGPARESRSEKIGGKAAQGIGRCA